MENIFNKIGYTLSSSKAGADDAELNVLFINNPDGSVRWIWNAKNKKPLFLKFYNKGSKRAKLFALMIQAIFVFGLQKLFFGKKTFYYKRSGTPLFDCTKEWAVFTGTTGPNNKAILYVDNSFFKIATTGNAQELIKKEHTALTDFRFRTFRVPTSTQISDVVVQLSDVTRRGVRTTRLGNSHLRALNEMYLTNDNNVLLGNWKLFNELKDRFAQINDSRIPKNMIRKINMLLESLNPDEVVSTALSHGDFTSWNMYESNGRISLYDWEMASCERPKGFDYFHFIIQQGVLVDRKGWNAIYYDINTQYGPDFFDIVFGGSKEMLQRYLKYYLLINCMDYLTVYATQPKWHIQVNWLLKTWNDALNLFVADKKSARQLLIMDLFDHVQNDNYAAVKFLNGYPENLSVNSDIDILVEKPLSTRLVQFFKEHSLVTKIVTTPKSFMNTVQLILVDGSFLSVDLIWQAKRRSIVFMDVQQTLANAYRNSFGVKTTSVSDTMQYLSGFYTLNNAEIPEKYRVYEEASVEMNTVNSSIVKEYFRDFQRDKKALLKSLFKMKQNKKFSRVKNILFYCYDTLTSFNRRGFVITFSGVDGAGKSTVIENVAKRIEKQLRRPVVVLRHRPSVLPIISVIFRGKEEAKRRVETSLPRMGTNNSLASSLMRFSYYYADYFIGQFLVFFKYTLRGYVVIYDRYYFDFIGDSRRSNVVLPKGLSAFGYNFLLKPKYNFFLFADAKTILERKKEMDETAINELTQSYGTLFNTLNRKSKTEVYEVIENKDLNLTLNRVLLTIANQ